MLAQSKELEYTMKAKSLGAYAVINRDQLPLQINSLLMGLIAEQRIPFARRHLLFAGLYFLVVVVAFLAVFVAFNYLDF